MFVSSGGGFQGRFFIYFLDVNEYKLGFYMISSDQTELHAR